MMLHFIIKSKLYNADFVRDRTEGFDNFLKEIERQDVDHLAKVAGVDKQLVKEAAIAYATARNSMEFHGLGVTEHEQGSKTVMLIADLAMITGNIGRKGVGVNHLEVKTMFKVQQIWDVNHTKVLDIFLWLMKTSRILYRKIWSNSPN